MGKRPPRKALWSGRFAAGPAAELRALNDSLWFDRALFAVDVAGSLAWADALALCGALTTAEVKKMRAGLRAVLALGPPAADTGDEDTLFPWNREHKEPQERIGDHNERLRIQICPTSCTAPAVPIASAPP